MKYAIIIPDGCSDLPMEQLAGKTPLQAARIPHMDAVAKQGMLAQTDNVPTHFPAGSEVANMTLFGYDPNTYFTGRAPSRQLPREFSWEPTTGPCAAIWSRSSIK